MLRIDSHLKVRSTHREHRQFSVDAHFSKDFNELSATFDLKCCELICTKKKQICRTNSQNGRLSLAVISDRFQLLRTNFSPDLASCVLQNNSTNKEVNCWNKKSEIRKFICGAEINLRVRQISLIALHFLKHCGQRENVAN